MNDKLVLIGLNEFNRNLLNEVSNILPKNNYLSKIKNLHSFRLLTEDKYESGYLEPWSQWVSLHTSTPSSDHKIKNLGDIPNLEYMQIWERLSKNNISSVVWGAMNASAGSSKLCKVFVPDPWVFSEDPKPNSLISFIALPRYLAKNYTSIKKTKVLSMMITFIKKSIDHVGLIIFLKSLKIIFIGLIKFGPKQFIVINFFDYLCANAFILSSKKHSSSFNFIFLNSIAHVQHHYWHSKKTKDLKEIVFTYKNIENILSIFDKELNIFSKNNNFILYNGLSQNTTLHEEPWYLYRIKDINKFMTIANIKYKKIETLMTNDAHMVHSNLEQLNDALEILDSINVNNKKFFFTEVDYKNLKIFFRIDFTSEIASNTVININGAENLFEDLVLKIVKRTGKHCQESNVIHNMDRISNINSKSYLNHDLFKIIYPNLFKE